MGTSGSDGDNARKVLQHGVTCGGPEQGHCREILAEKPRTPGNATSSGTCTSSRRGDTRRRTLASFGGTHTKGTRVLVEMHRLTSLDRLDASLTELNLMLREALVRLPASGLRPQASLPSGDECAGSHVD